MLRWCAVVLWVGIIFALSSIPSLASPFASFYDFVLRKLAHMGVYAVLTALLFCALRRHTNSKRQALLFAVLLAGIYALSDEWHQTFVAGRHGSFRDVGIDTLGIAAGYTLVQLTRIQEAKNKYRSAPCPLAAAAANEGEKITVTSPAHSKV